MTEIRVTENGPDPAAEWSALLDRLDGVRRDAVVRALRRSASTGWPASRDGVELLVAYALGEITSQQHVAGLLRSWGVPVRTRSNGVVPRRHLPEPQPAPQPESERDPEAEVEPEPRPEQPPARSPREEAVHAYVTGLIDVGEFLRIARS